MIRTDPFLAATAVIDCGYPRIRSLAHQLAWGADDPETIARRCYEWVRDEIRHSRDFGLSPVPCSASEVLEHASGYCYAKSHLLAALLRANGIPAGFCYQRLIRDENGPRFCLHGLNAVFLPRHGWYRIDARGNRKGLINTRFSPPVQSLAYEIEHPGEANLPEILSEPLEVVIQALQSHTDANKLWEQLPDIEPNGDAAIARIGARTEKPGHR